MGISVARARIGAGAALVWCGLSGVAAADEGGAAAPARRAFAEPGRWATPLAGFVGFGGPGFFVASVGPLTFDHGTSRDGQGGGTDRTFFGFAPDVDFFVGRRVSLGGALQVSYGETRSGSAGAEARGSTLVLAARPRVGMLFPLGEDVALWPRIEVGPGVTSTSSEGGMAPTRSTALSVEGAATLGVLVQFHDRLALDVGPTVTARYEAPSSRSGAALPSVFPGSGGSSADVHVGVRSRLLLLF